MKENLAYRRYASAVNNLAFAVKVVEESSCREQFGIAVARCEY